MVQQSKEKRGTAMLVLVDVEWIEVVKKAKHMTQIAAMRVNDFWEEAAEFSAIICPPDDSLCYRQHMAFSGYPAEVFLTGLTAEEAILLFAEWLEKDDVLCVWHYESKLVLEAAWKAAVGKPLRKKVVCANHKIYDIAEEKKITGRSLYSIALSMGIPAPTPQHCSRNDVVMMRSLFSEVKLSQKQLESSPQRGKVKDQAQERNRRIIDKSPYLYFYVRGSRVFHTRDCRVIQGVENLEGCTLYKNAVKERRPCRICSPQPEALPVPKPEGKRYVPTLEEKERAGRNKEVIRARMLGGAVLEIRRGNIVGCCHNLIHPGKLTKSLMLEHDCLGKQCAFFEKYQESGYWQEQLRKKKQRESRKREKQLSKAAAAAEMETLQLVRENFQACAEATDSALDIIRVENPKSGEYTVFYVSDNRFADGNRFKDFTKEVTQRYRCKRIMLKHIRDVDGHFVTREEYYARKRGQLR